MLLDQTLRCLVHIMNVFFIELEDILINYATNGIVDKRLQISELVDAMFGFGDYPLSNKLTSVKNTTATFDW